MSNDLTPENDRSAQIFLIGREQADIISAYAHRVVQLKRAQALFAQWRPEHSDFCVTFMGEKIFNFSPRDYCFLRDTITEIPLKIIQDLNFALRPRLGEEGLLDLSPTLCEFISQNPTQDPMAAGEFLDSIANDDDRKIMQRIINILLHDVTDPVYENSLFLLAHHVHTNAGMEDDPDLGNSRIDGYLQAPGAIFPDELEILEELKLVAAKKVYSEMPDKERHVFSLLTKKSTADEIEPNDYRLIELLVGEEISAFIPISEDLPGRILTLVNLYSVCERLDFRGALTGMHSENYETLCALIGEMPDEGIETLCRVMSGGPSLSDLDKKMTRLISVNDTSFGFYFSELARYSNSKLIHIQEDGKPQPPPPIEERHRPEPPPG